MQTLVEPFTGFVQALFAQLVPAPFMHGTFITFLAHMYLTVYRSGARAMKAYHVDDKVLEAALLALGGQH